MKNRVVSHWPRFGIFSKCLTLALTLFTSSISNSETTGSAIEVASVPPGFQFLLEKQTTAVDVFYGDVFLTTTLATYSPETIEFHNPDEIILQLTNLIAPDQVQLGLSGEIDSHIGEVCYRPGDVDCGSLEPEEVGVIFDEGRFRADVFINPNLLAVQQRTFNKYLPPPESDDYSYVNRLSMIYSGDSSGGDQLALNGQTLVSWGKQRVVSRWALQDQSGGSSQGSVQTLAWQMDATNLQYQAGWFQSDSRYLSFVPSLDLLGYSMATSYKARTDLDFAKGTIIELFLPTRSKIKVFRNGRFITSGFYDPGNQQLDTSGLPDGAYEIEIVIEDSAGQESIERRFFVKTPKITPAGEYQYFFEVGDVQESSIDDALPKSQNEFLAQGGFSMQFSPVLGFNAGAAMTQSEMVFEVGVYFVDDYIDLEPKLMLGVDGEYGYSMNGYFRYQDLSMSYQMLRTWTDNDNNLDVAQDTDFHLIPEDRKLRMINFNYPVYDGHLGARFSYNKRSDEPSAFTRSISYQQVLAFEDVGGRFRLMTEYSQSDEGDLFMLSVNWFYREDTMTHSVDMSYRDFDRDPFEDEQYIRASYNGSWNDGSMYDDDLIVNWRAQLDEDANVYGADTSYASEYGYVKAAYDYIDGSADTRQTYVAEATTTIAGNGGVISFGGKRFAEGALVLQVADNGTDSIFDIIINRVKYGEIKVGQTLVVPVAAYQEYDVLLKDRGTDFVSFASRYKRSVIYPGNAALLQWEPRSIVVLVARVVTRIPGCFEDESPDCWVPLSQARAKGEAVYGFSRTDPDGYLQAEVYRSHKHIIFKKKGVTCTAKVPDDAEVTNGVIFLDDDLKCYDAEEILPEDF